MTRILTAVVMAGLVAGATTAAEVNFPLTGENTKVTFVGSKPDGKHEGGFKTIKGTATLDATDPTSLQIAVEIDMNSTWSDDEKLTAHLKSPDFFGVKNNPTAKFVTSKVVKGIDGYTITGRLTLNGKSKDVTFPANIQIGRTGLTLTSNFKIDRNDWGISYGKGKINDDVLLSVTINAKQ